jgi:methylmalonyl-CoA/ethylmalonyl-CoA epimerase
MITGIDHIGIFVTDLDEALRFYTETLGLSAGPIETLTSPPVRIARVAVGDTELELIEASDPEQTMMRYLPHRHPGPYHVGLRVESVDHAAERLRADGVPLIDGIREGDDMRVQFVDPGPSGGLLIELVTRKKKT